MKRWMSVFSAIGMLSISLVALFYSVVAAKVQLLQTPASPVYASTSDSITTPSTDAYANALRILNSKGITLAFEQNIPLGYAATAPLQQDSLLAKQAVVMLAEEFNKYTANYIANSGLAKIYLVSTLLVEGQYRSGMPEPVLEDALYFAASTEYVTSEGGSYLRRTFHHEYKHLIDYNMYGSYDGTAATMKKCNVTGTLYGSGGGAMYDNPAYAHTEHPKEGFVNGYATSGIEEDSAEIYALYMTNPEKLQTLATSDAAISCKVNYMRKDLAKL